MLTSIPDLVTWQETGAIVEGSVPQLQLDTAVEGGVQNPTPGQAPVVEKVSLLVEA